MNRELFDYQQTAIDNLRLAFSGGVRKVVLQAPTGSGKTIVASAILEMALKKGHRCTFVVPAISLIDQTVERFREEGITDIGVIQANHPMTNYSRSIQICSIQTLKSRGYFPNSKMIIYDEVHQLHSHHIKWLSDPAFDKAYFVGLSATPWTKGLGRHFDKLVITAPMQDLIDAGRLSKFKVFSCPRADVSDVNITAGDYQIDQLSEASRKGTLTADIIKTWQERWNKPKTLVFAVDLNHAQVLLERFNKAGHRFVYQDASTPNLEREGYKRQLNDSSIDGIVSVGTLTMGFDADVRCIVYARPTKSEMLYVQIFGRGLRTAAGKDHLTFLDHTETTQTLGFPTDIHHDELDCSEANVKSAPAERTPNAPKPCPACAALSMRIARVCQNCGHSFPLAPPLNEADGQLTEMVPGKRQKVAGRREYSMTEKREWQGMLVAYARRKGYKDGWGANQYRDKFGVWPASKTVPILDPSYEVLSWIKSRQIAYAKARAKERLPAAAGELVP